MLHLGARRPLDERGRRPLRQPGRDDQPQRPASGSLDAARRQASVHGGRAAGRDAAALARRASEIRAIPGLDVLDERLVGDRACRLGPAAVAIDVRGTG